jgi:hypothetical protein
MDDEFSLLKLVFLEIAIIRDFRAQKCKQQKSVRVSNLFENKTTVKRSHHARVVSLFKNFLLPFNAHR